MSMGRSLVHIGDREMITDRFQDVLDFLEWRKHRCGAAIVTTGPLRLALAARIAAVRRQLPLQELLVPGACRFAQDELVLSPWK